MEVHWGCSDAARDCMTKGCVEGAVQASLMHACAGVGKGTVVRLTVLRTVVIRLLLFRVGCRNS